MTRLRTGRVVVIKTTAELALRATGLVTFPLLARQAGAEGYGAYTQVNNVVAFVIPFASLGLSGAMVRFFAPRSWGSAARRDLRRVLATVLLASCAFAAILAAVAGPLNRLVLDWPDGATLFRAASLLVMVGAVEQVALNLLWARDRLIAYSGYQMAQAAVLVGALVSTLRGPDDLVRSIIALVIGRGLLAAFALLAVWRGPQGATGTVEQPVAVGAMIRYGFPVAVSAIGLWIINLADRVVIGHLRSASELGRYGAVYTMASLLAIATGPFYLPALGRLMRSTRAGDHDAVAADISLFHRYVSIGAVGAAVALVMLIQPGVRVIGGDEFAVSYWLVAMIVGGLFFDQWNGMAHYVLLCNDRTTLLQNAWLGAGVVNVLANLVAVPHYGVEGAAAITLATFALLNGVLFAAARRYTPLDRAYRWRTTGRALVAGLVAAGASLPFLGGGAGVLSMLVGAGVFTVIYLVALVVLRELKVDDIRTVRDVFRPIAADPSDPAPVVP